jgi:cytochrome c553
MSLHKVFIALGLIMIIDSWACGGWSARAAPPNPKAGAAISGQCAVCHGNNGISVANNIPNLAGQHYQYLLAQLKAFKNGTRKNSLMQEMVLSLSLQQMKDIAAYFASVKIRVSQSEGGEPEYSHSEVSAQ